MGIRDYEFRGRTYDQWELGEEFITGARTITEADIVNFAGLSGDWSATHTNDVYGRGTPGAPHFQRKGAHITAAPPIT